MCVSDLEAIGVDIGGTAVKLGRVDARGRVLAHAELQTPADLSAEDAVARIAAAIPNLTGVTAALPVGVGCAGLVDSARGVVDTSPNLPRWGDVPLAQMMEASTRMRTAVLNDANAFTLAEARLGAGEGRSPVVGITLGTGVGGGIVTAGHLFGGSHGFAGEIGHMSVRWDGEPCPCGNAGCLELDVGRRPLVTRYLRRAAWKAGTPAFDLCQGEVDALSPKLLAEAAQHGDDIARDVYRRAGEILGVALANIANLVDPAVIVIGGGIAQAGALILDPAREQLARRAMAARWSVPPVEPAALGVRAGVIGAALFALDAGDAEGPS